MIQAVTKDTDQQDLVGTHLHGVPDGQLEIGLVLIMGVRYQARTGEFNLAPGLYAHRIQVANDNLRQASQGARVQPSAAMSRHRLQ
jgi:hypothetical protein